MCLTSLAYLAPKLTEDNVDMLFEEAVGKTTREVKEMVEALNPKPPVDSTIRKKPVRVREESSEVRNDQSAAVEPSEEPEGPAPSELSISSRGTEPKPEGSLEVAQNELYNFRFAGGKELREKLERFAEVIGVENAERHMPEIIEKALDLALDKKDPQRNLERRRKKEEKARAKTRAHELSSEGEQRQRKKSAGGVDERQRARYVSSSEREIQFEDASYQCEYVGPEGVRCTARVGLQIDHIKPVGKGGSKEGNLRALCRSHNLFCAGREFGEEFMRRKIEGRRTENCSGRSQGEEPRALEGA